MSSIWQQKGRFRTSNFGDDISLRDLLPVVKFQSGLFYEYRPIGAPYDFAEHWIRLMSKADKEYSKRKVCLGYNPKTGKVDGYCPYCELGDKPKITALMNAIDRKEQRLMPAMQPNWLDHERVPRVGPDGFQHYYKDKDSESWTPVVPIQLPPSACEMLQNFVGTNSFRDPSTGQELVFDPHDQQFGFDFKLKYEKEQKPNPYFLQKTNNTQLQEYELYYLLYDLAVEEPEDTQTAEKNAQYFQGRLAPPREGNNSGGRAAARGGALAGIDAGANSEGFNQSFDPSNTPDARARGGNQGYAQQGGGFQGGGAPQGGGFRGSGAPQGGGQPGFGGGPQGYPQGGGQQRGGGFQAPPQQQPAYPQNTGYPPQGQQQSYPPQQNQGYQQRGGGGPRSPAVAQDYDQQDGGGYDYRDPHAF